MMSLKSEIRQRKSATGSKDDTDDGMEDVIDLPIWKLRFPKDHRVQEVRRLLCSSRPVTVTLPTAQQQGLSEHELIEEREKQLLVLCIRIMALPIGRGMFTTWTTTPTVTETLTVPKFVAISIQFLILFLDNYFQLFLHSCRLCLTGKTPQTGATVDMTHIDVPPNSKFGVASSVA